MASNDWNSCKFVLPENGVEILTKIDDEKGCRNETTLKRQGRLWFFPDMSMYVYYDPTHWQPIIPTPSSLERSEPMASSESVAAELRKLVEKWRNQAMRTNEAKYQDGDFLECSKELEPLIARLEAPVEIPARSSIAQQSGKLSDSPVKRDSFVSTTSTSLPTPTGTCSNCGYQVYSGMVHQCPTAVRP